MTSSLAAIFCSFCPSVEVLVIHVIERIGIERKQRDTDDLQFEFFRTKSSTVTFVEEILIVNQC
jgi:hypothetical protein